MGSSYCHIYPLAPVLPIVNQVQTPMYILCLCEIFGINDCEIHISDFTEIRCDCFSREGGGVCIYLRNSISFKTCLKFSNSVCDLLIVSLQTPSLIIIFVYLPPSCPVNDFEEISLKIHTYVMSLSSPLPNMILLGDFNLPETLEKSLLPYITATIPNTPTQQGYIILYSDSTTHT